MKALSIRQPWAWAILHAGKRVENREWDRNGGNISAARSLIGQTIAIHTGAGCTREEYESAGEFMADWLLAGDARASLPGKPTLPPLASLPRGAIVGRARLVGVVHTFDAEHRRRALAGGGSERVCLLCGGVADVSGEQPAPCPKADPWAIPGTVGLILADVVALEKPVPFRGMLGFFEVPDEAVK